MFGDVEKAFERGLEGRVGERGSDRVDEVGPTQVVVDEKECVTLFQELGDALVRREKDGFELGRLFEGNVGVREAV